MMKYINTNLLYFLILFISISCASCIEYNSNGVYDIKNNHFYQGVYNHATFKSKARGDVPFNVYLPPNWSKDNDTEYPLIILLHGQGEDEYKFVDGLPKSKLNAWIKAKELPEMVVIALKGGDNTNEMQWYTRANETMIISEKEGELRAFCHKIFNTTLDASKISVIGHSRGATGALNFALDFPNKFASAVSSAFVSDYALSKLKNLANKNRQKIINSGIKINMLIGDKDQFVLNNKRKGSPILHKYLKSKGISNDLEIIEGKRHQLGELWAYPTNLKYLKLCAAAWSN